MPIRLPRLVASCTITFAAMLAACSDGTAPAEHPAPVRAEPVIQPVHDVWGTKPALPAGRWATAVAGVNHTLYVIGGLTPTENALATVRAWSPASGDAGAWAARASLPNKRSFPNGATVIDGKIYLPGGMNGTGVATRTLFVYDPAANAWSTKAQMPGAGGGGGSVAIGGKLYVVTHTADKPVSSLFRYNPATNKWATRAAAPANLSGAVLGAIGGKLYAAGGGPGLGGVLSSLYVYDPASDTWSPRASLPIGRTLASGAAIGGKLYVAGGATSGTEITDRLDAYDPATDSWKQLRKMPMEVRWAGSTALDGLLYSVGGGNKLATLSTVAAYLP